MKRQFTFMLMLLAGATATAQIPTVSTFDQLKLVPDSFNNTADMNGGFYDGDAFFVNSYDTAWGVWSGFALSNKSDRTTPGFGNQYSTYARSGPARSYGNFMVGTGEPTVIWNGDTRISGVYVCNTTYTALSMLNGDQFAKKFGGPSGNDPDFLMLTAKGYRNGNLTDTAYIYLANYTFNNNDYDYVLDYWTYFDLRRLGVVDSVKFFLSSSDNGEFGMNTPGYFCIEDLNWAKPERYLDGLWVDDFNSNLVADSFNNGSDLRDGFLFDAFFYPNQHDFDWGTWTGWSLSSMGDTMDKTYMNQYSAVTGSGYEDAHYMVSFGNSMAYTTLDTMERHIALKRDYQEGAWFTNTTYTYDQIKNGSNFCKKFGGPDGSDPDYFRLIITGYGPFGTIEGIDTFYLADYRFEEDSLDYIVDEWTYVPLECMQVGKVLARITYVLESSDTGEFGMNTPAYFAMDDNGIYFSSVHNNETKQVSVYPNPTNAFISLPLDRVDSWSILGMDGRKYLSGSTAERKIDVGQLAPGVYFIQVEKEHVLYTGKFIRN